MKPTQRIILLKDGIKAVTISCVCGCSMWTSRKVWSKDRLRILGYNYKCFECGRIEKE